VSYFREELLKDYQYFFDAMKSRMEVKQKEYGDNWMFAELRDLFSSLIEKYEKWTRDLNNKLHLVDLANHCMILWLRLELESE